MGKTKKKAKRTSSDAENNGLDDELNATVKLKSSHQELIAEILQQVQSSHDMDKICGCNKGAHIIEASILKCLMVGGFGKICIPLLLHSNLQVRLAAVGSLRNLSVTGGSELSIQLCEDNVTPSLISLLQEYENMESMKQFDHERSGKTVCNAKKEIFINAVHLLLNICEFCPPAVVAVTKSQVIKTIVMYLSPEVYGHDVCHPIGEFLQVVSENNPVLSEELNQYDIIIKQFKRPMGVDPDSMYLQVLLGSTLFNMHYGSLDVQFMPQLILMLSDCIKMDTTSLLQNVIITGAGEEEEESPACHQAAQTLKAQQISLEILTNLCSADDENEEEGNLDYSDEEEENFEGEVCGIENQNPSELSPQVCECLVHHKVVNGVIDLCGKTSSELKSSLETIKEGKQLIDGLEGVQSTAMSCLSNMLMSLDVDQLGGKNLLSDLWMQMQGVLLTLGVLEGMRYDAVVTILRSLLQKSTENNIDLISQLGGDDLKVLREHCLSTPSVQAKCNLVQILSMMSVLAFKTGNELVNVIARDTGLFLLDLCHKDHQVIVMAEALDAIITTFSEDSLDKVATEIKLVQGLKNLQMLFSEKVKSQKKQLLASNNYAVVDTARLNLRRFINYKLQFKS